MPTTPKHSPPLSIGPLSKNSTPNLAPSKTKSDHETTSPTATSETSSSRSSVSQDFQNSPLVKVGHL